MMDWARDLPSWSNASLSRRVSVRPIDWHVQEVGKGPLILLLPGAGASVHTWRFFLPALAKAGFRAIAIDLPGQGFSRGPVMRMGLEAMSEDIARLAASEGWHIHTAIGHSAGAAIALRLTQRLGVPKVVGLNPALDNFKGIAEWLFPLMAKVLALNPFTANLFTLTATRAAAARLIRGTGSQIDDAGLDYYHRLFQNRNHVDGALQMMAQWSLTSLVRDLPQIEAEALFLTGETDKAVPPTVAAHAAAAMPNCTHETLEGLGHLAHEEDPETVEERVTEFLSRP